MLLMIATLGCLVPASDLRASCGDYLHQPKKSSQNNGALAVVGGPYRDALQRVTLPTKPIPCRGFGCRQDDRHPESSCPATIPSDHQPGLTGDASWNVESPEPHPWEATAENHAIGLPPGRVDRPPRSRSN